MDGLKILVKTADGKEATYSLRPKILVAFELGKKEFDDLFRKLNTKSDKIFLSDNGRITIDISGINFHFVCEGAE